ncbi:MAG TPA: hypothetical protein VJ850_01370 [Candidatus Limnocylindrales bacterium]|nr:hypothetical protein [Candidatus Limnocylindrales bacterium]
MTDAEAPRTCAWCATPAAADATVCGSCGAALAQHESLGDVRIPGLTGLDPALEDFDKRPMHLRGPSPTQGAASGLIVGAAAGGPIGAMVIGGVVAMAAAEYLGASQPGTAGTALENVGKPSELALQAAAKAAANPTPAPEAPAEPAKPDEPDAAAADGGMSVWRDLPTPEPETSSE